jgi:hypothetical protein
MISERGAVLRTVFISLLAYTYWLDLSSRQSVSASLVTGYSDYLLLTQTWRGWNVVFMGMFGGRTKKNHET